MSYPLKAVVVFYCLLLGACATHRPELKAPCDPNACIDRININSWNKGE